MAVEAVETLKMMRSSHPPESFSMFIAQAEIIFVNVMLVEDNAQDRRLGMRIQLLRLNVLVIAFHIYKPNHTLLYLCSALLLLLIPRQPTDALTRPSISLAQLQTPYLTYPSPPSYASPSNPSPHSR